MTRLGWHRWWCWKQFCWQRRGRRAARKKVSDFSVIELVLSSDFGHLQGRSQTRKTQREETRGLNYIIPFLTSANHVEVHGRPTVTEEDLLTARRSSCSSVTDRTLEFSVFIPEGPPLRQTALQGSCSVCLSGSETRSTTSLSPSHPLRSLGT